MPNHYLNLPIKYFVDDTFNDDRFLKLKLYVMHDGINLNKSKFDMDAIEKAKDSIANIPILAYIKYDEDGSKDFTEHEIIIDENGVKYLEQPVGIVPEDNNYHYEEIDGRTYVVVDAYVWKVYAQDAVDILTKNKGAKISMEILVYKSKYNKKTGIENILEYSYTGITLLGQNVESGMINARAEVFSQRVAKMLQEFKKFFGKEDKSMNFIAKDEWGTGDPIEIDLSKDAADYNTPWGEVDKTKLRNDILKAKNYKELVKAAYLVVLDGWEDAPSENLKYPVCMIKDKKLVLSANGCQAALSFLEKNTNASYYDEAKKKLKKYYEILGLDTSNFVLDDVNDIGDSDDEQLDEDERVDIEIEFSLTQEQLEEELRRQLEKIEYLDEYWKEELSRYYLIDYDDKFVYAWDNMNAFYVKIPYTMQGDNPVLDFENVTRIKFIPVDWEDGGKDVVSEFTKQNNKNFIQKLKAISDQNRELHEKYSKLEEELKDKSVQLNELLAFKEEVERKEYKAKVDSLLNSLDDILSNDEIQLFVAKADNYNKFEDFEKDVKAFVGEKMITYHKNGLSFIKMNPNNDDNVHNESPNIWERLEKNIN